MPHSFETCAHWPISSQFSGQTTICEPRCRPDFTALLAFATRRMFSSVVSQSFSGAPWILDRPAAVPESFLESRLEEVARKFGSGSQNNR